MSDPRTVTRADLLSLYPEGRDPKVSPIAGDIIDKDMIRFTVLASNEKLVMTTAGIWTIAAWRTEAKAWHVHDRAEDLFSDELKRLYRGEIVAVVPA